jgi:hypothetical protein
MNVTEPAAARVENVSVGCRYPDDRVSMLDVIRKRRGDADRAATIRYALDRLIEEHFPGATAQPEPKMEG